MYVRTASGLLRRQNGDRGGLKVARLAVTGKGRMVVKGEGVLSEAV
jgi:hypothetical protein